MKQRPEGRAGRIGQRPEGRAILLAIVLGLGVAAPGCALWPRDADAPERALEQRLAREAAALPGFSAGAGIVAVPAATPEAGWQELVRIRSQGPSPLSRQLGEAFAETRGQARDLVVGGPHAPLVERVLLDAFALSRAPELSGLRLLLVSPEPPSEALRDAADELDVALLYRRLPEPRARR